MNTVAPIKSWLWTMVISATLIPLALFMVIEWDKKYLEDRLGPLVDLKVNKEADFRIAILGNSLTREALSDASYLERLLEEKYDKRFTVLKINKGGIELHDFAQYDELYTQLSRFEPDFIFIQESLLAFGDKNWNWKYSFRRYISFRKLWNYVFEAENTKVFLSNTNLGKYQTLDTFDIESNAKRFKEKKTLILEKDGQRIADFVLNVKSEKSQVIALSLPYPKQFEDIMKKHRSSKEYQELSGWLQKEYGLKYMFLDFDMPLSMFYDHGHMNQQGEGIFTDWFIDRVGNLVDTLSSNK